MIALSTLARGHRARIARIDADDALARRLLSLGVQEGFELELLHEGPFCRDPIAIRLHERIIALRRRDASHIMVELLA